MDMKNLFVFFILFIPGVFPVTAIASKLLPWATQQLASSLSVYEDKRGNLSLGEIKQVPVSQFKPGDIHQNFGFTTSAWWLRFQLQNPNQQDDLGFLRLANGHIHEVQFYLEGPDSTIQYRTGNHYPYSSKPLKATEYLFPMDLKAGQVYAVYLRLEKKGAELNAPLQILRNDFDYTASFNIWNLFFGGTFLYILILLIGVCIIRTKLIVYYFAYATSLCLYMATAKGVAFSLLWPNQAWLQTNALELSKHLANIFYILFILKFIGWQSRYPQAIPFLKLCMLLSGLNIACRLIYASTGLIPDILMMRFVEVTALLLPVADIFLVLLLYQSWKANKKTEEFWLLFITACLFIPLVFLVCLHFGWIAALPFYPNLLVLLFLTEIICISAIIVYRYYQLFKKELIHLREITLLKKKAVENILLGQEEERIRIAKDLHDGISLSLANIRMRMSLFENQLEKPGQKNQLRDLLNRLAEASREVRTISHNLAPLSIQHQELTKAIEELVYQIELTDANMDIEINYPPDINKNLSAVIKQNIYQTVRELFNNILKYAQASRIRVNIIRENGHFQLQVEDNGHPYDAERALSETNGLGLSSIRSRATLLNGWFLAKPRSEGGMIHLFSIPVSA